MSTLPSSYSLPTYSEKAREDTLMHHTTANGLLGIFRSNEIWSTAYYCTNDESELSAGKGVLTPLFRAKTHELIQTADPVIRKLKAIGVDPRDLAETFEQRLLAEAVSFLGVYITCFCKPNDEGDFLHGLLSQWRGYGVDGGYALQISRSKLQALIDQTQNVDGPNYDLQNVYYSPDNPLKEKVLNHSAAFTGAYLESLNNLANWDLEKMKRFAIANLTGGPIERLLDFFINTKTVDFKEENECRLNVLESLSSGSGVLPVHYFNRDGLLVPYTKTPSNFNILECVEWIIVGPAPRSGDRFNSVKQMVRKMGLQIEVRPSSIPFSRA